MKVPQALTHLVSIDPDIVGGEPVFTGTRVPLETVVDNVAAGHGPEEILRNYPSLKLEHIRAVLSWERDLARREAGLSIRTV